MKLLFKATAVVAFFVLVAGACCSMAHSPVDKRS